MEHFLITRFNVPVNGWDRDKAGQPTLDDDWMKHRLRLFQRFCVPTVAGQTENNFNWIIYCDTNSKSTDVEAIQKAITNLSNTRIRLVPDFHQLLNDLKLLLSNSDSEFVITSRVDNDDGLGKNYIREIQNHFLERGNTIINLNGGVLYDEDKKVLTEIRKGRNNHYGSLIEEKNPQNNLVTVLGFPHDKPPAIYQVINVDRRFSWLKIIHSRNLSSRIHGKPVSLDKVLPHFTFDKADIPLTSINKWKYVGSKFIETIKRNLSSGK